MNLKSVFKGQYRAEFEMLRQCVERCPDDLWLSGKHPRNYWRIAFHAAYYTHLYLHADRKSFVPWSKDRDTCAVLWGRPKVLEPYSRADILEYLDEISAGLDAYVDALDLEASDCGFAYYKGMAKIDHQFANLRHLQGHVGQLSELLLARRIDTDWIGSR